MLYDLGARVQDLVGVRFNSFAKQKNGQGTFLWVAQKTETKRAGTLSAETMRLLKEVQTELKRADNDLLFPQHTNSNIATYFGHFFSRTLKLQEHSHNFRTTKITDLLAQGTDLKTVQRYVGHKSPSTTLGYQQLDVLEANKKVAELMCSSSKASGSGKPRVLKKRDQKKSLKVAKK